MIEKRPSKAVGALLRPKTTFCGVTSYFLATTHQALHVDIHQICREGNDFGCTLRINSRGIQMTVTHVVMLVVRYLLVLNNNELVILYMWDDHVCGKHQLQTFDLNLKAGG